MIERRSVLLGLGALFAAPAIVKVSSLMKVAPTGVIRFPGNSYLAIEEISREAVEMFVNSNSVIDELNKQYDKEFAAEGAKIGSTFRVRLPSDYYVSDGPRLSLQDPTECFDFVEWVGKEDTTWPSRVAVDYTSPQIPDSLAVAAVAVAAVPVLLAKPVTRRFWSK